LVKRYVSTDAQAAPPGFQDLFTGALAQWSVARQGAQNFRVLQGLNILEAGNFGGGPDLGIIYFKGRQFQDFRLIVDWKAFSVTANSGVFLRMPEPLGQLTDAFYAGFTEIQIDERGIPRTTVGCKVLEPVQQSGVLESLRNKGGGELDRGETQRRAG
jgi:hypothetical protein